MTHTQNRSKKLLKNKNKCTIFFLFNQFSLSPPISYFDNAIAKNQTISFFFFLLFRQCHCHKPIATKKNFCPPISAMPLPQIHSHKFFPLYFGPQINCNNFFPSYFGNAIATNLFPQFFFLLFR